MPALDIQSRSLSSMYVFYERLKDSGPTYRKTYDTIKRNLRDGGKFRNALGSEDVTAAKQLLRLAQNEEKKEKALLRKVYGINVGSGAKDSTASADGAKKIIELLNETMNLKKVYERNVALIKNTKGQKTVTAFFGTYFGKVWDKYEGKISRKIISQIKKGVKINSAIENVIDEVMPEIVQEALILQFSANQENGLNKTGKDYSDAYAEVVEALQKYRGKAATNPFVQNMCQVYQVDKIKNSIKKRIKESKSKRGVSLMSCKQAILGNTRKNKVAMQTAAGQGGLEQEFLENFIFMLQNNKNQGYKIEGISSGEKKIKADNIYTYGIDKDAIEKITKENSLGNYVDNNRAFEILRQRLDKINNSFIVYSSSKLYTLNENFSKRGYSAGTAIKMDSFKEIFSNIDKNFVYVVGAILQLGKGAIGNQENYKEDLSRLLAQDVAYLLFDDTSSIGDFKETTTNAIHIMNLNGILIPLSFFLYLIYRTITDYTKEKNLSKLVRVTITTPEILYPTQQSQAGIKNAWDIQRTAALQKDTISIHFLRNFSELIKQYL